VPLGKPEQVFQAGHPFCQSTDADREKFPTVPLHPFSIHKLISGGRDASLQACTDDRRQKEKALVSIYRADAITLVLASIVAPVSSSNATIPLRPHLAATCSGVIEFYTKRIHSTFNQSMNQSIRQSVNI